MLLQTHVHFLVLRRNIFANVDAEDIEGDPEELDPFEFEAMLFEQEDEDEEEEEEEQGEDLFNNILSLNASYISVLILVSLVSHIIKEKVSDSTTDANSTNSTEL